MRPHIGRLSDRAITVTGGAHGIGRAYCERRPARNRGLNLSSGSIAAAPPQLVHYITSKAGIVGLTRALARVARTLGNATPPDLKETFSWRLGVPIPQEPTDLGAIWNEYFTAMHRLGLDLLRACTLALDLPEDSFDAMVSPESCTLVAHNYPPHFGEVLPGQLRAGEHTDFGTVVPQQEDVARSRRLSIPFFQLPRHEHVIRCIETCQSPGNPARYPPITAGEHDEQKLRSTVYQPR